MLRKAEFWGLNDISFELRRGESLAIIGANGAGKSTLLKILNGLIKPDAGQVRIKGRVGALIELGIGLNPVLSGRENIYMRAILLGLSRQQVKPLIEPIIEFTGLGEAIEMPVQFYSSGMSARLAYAVAAHLNPDILLVDEVLAVGDMEFQRKCILHMLGYLKAGGSIILVSHAMHHIQAVCQRGIMLEKGQITFTGSAIDTLDRYFEKQLSKLDGGKTGFSTDITPDRPVAIENVTLQSNSGKTVQTGGNLTIHLAYRSLKPIHNIGWSFSFLTQEGMICITGAICFGPITLHQGAHTLHCNLKQLPLTPGEYGLRVVLFELGSQQPIAHIGIENPPMRVRVHGEAGIEKNAQYIMQQLVVLDVDWNC
jgi:lipopolysaccharide transport system ATP-binding protein